MNLVSGGFGGAGGSSSNGFDVGTNPDVVSVAISHLYGEFYHTWGKPSPWGTKEMTGLRKRVSIVQ